MGSLIHGKIRVAIIGGGIAGLILAIALAPFERIEIDIYEGAVKFEPIGAGLGLWGEAITVCKKLGIEKRLARIAPAIKDPSYTELRKANLTEGRDLGKVVLSRTMGFHRGELLNALVHMFEETGRGSIHFAKRCVSYAQPSRYGEEVVIYFKDGSTATCDVLIGCDGIKSVVRKQLLNELGWKPQDPDVDSSGLRFTGMVAYRALISPQTPGDHPASRGEKIYCGSYKHIITYPVSNGKLINLGAYSSNPSCYDEWKNGPWTLDEKGNEALKEFSDLETEVQALLKKAVKTSRWAVYEVDPLPHWTVNRVAVLGDAAHAMSPAIGCGGGQVFESAYVLAQLLGNPEMTHRDIPHVLRCYEYVRKGRAEKVLECTREAQRVFQSIGKYANASDEYIHQSLCGLVGWLCQGNYDLDREIAKAKKEFERLRKGS